ncbi:MAG TPA: DUF3822 family protein [Bacteroidia bacterium]|nr:DUF3822 family protein [Bacteroidia bacterium]
MELTSSKVRVKQSLVDESYNPDAANHYRLFIQLGNDFLSAALLDDTRKKFICLEDFHFPFSETPGVLAEKCELARQQSKILLPEGFRSVNCCVNFPKSILVPEPLYDKTSEKQELDFNFGESMDEIVLSDNLELVHAKNLFSIPPVIQKMLHYWFGDISICHQSTAFINSVLISNKNRQDKTVTVNVRSADFDLAVAESGRLFFYNRFHYKTSEDFLYFILFVFEQLQLNPETVEMKFAGEADSFSALYKDACRYIKNVSCCEQLSPYKYSYKLEALQPGAYYTLFSQHLCGS